MLQPGAQTAALTATGVAGATPAAGAGPSSDMSAIGEVDRGVRGEESGGGISGGNRWPKQETLELLKIRSDMDAVFRDSNLKGYLWEEVSRKMAEKGYRRSAKKCREKFENVYKYHKRTKDTRAAKGPDKTYRFFDQLAALDGSSGQSSSSFVPPSSAGSPPVESAVPIAMAMPPPRPPPQPPTSIHSQVMISTTPSAPFQLVMPAIHRIPPSAPVQPSGSPSLSSSSTSSDEGVAAMRSRRKRKWKQFFDRLMEGVMEKQEELQRKFLEAIDEREKDRRIREEAWKAQEAARLKREHEILVQERSMAAAKDAALVSFLQKLSDHQQIPLPPAILQYSSQYQPPPPPPPPRPPPQKEAGALMVAPVPENYNVGEASASAGAGSSRWPKAEVEALIRLRTGMDQKYEEGGPKGPLWEEISAAMRREGYHRNAKRCKEKWENINKYYKKVKDSDRKRRDDSKTCPYYHQLDAIYRAKAQLPPPPVAALPEQRWGPPQHPPQDPGSGNIEELYDDDEEGEEEEEDQAGGWAGGSSS